MCRGSARGAQSKSRENQEYGTEVNTLALADKLAPRACQETNTSALLPTPGFFNTNGCRDESRTRHARVHAPHLSASAFALRERYFKVHDRPSPDDACWFRLASGTRRLHYVPRCRAGPARSGSNGNVVARLDPANNILSALFDSSVTLSTGRPHHLNCFAASALLYESQLMDAMTIAARQRT